jgi:sugar (pentulose or hexulose) kinase
MFGGLLKAAGNDMPKGKLYDTLYELAAEGAPDCGGIVSYNYYAGEEITGLTEGRPMVFRDPGTKFTIQNFMRSLVYSCYATLKLGMDILTEEEQVRLERIYAHGGLFKNPVPSQRILAAALGADITLMESAGEGGAWGIALLASYTARDNKAQTLQEFLNTDVFKGGSGNTVSPDKADAEGMQAYMKLYKAGLSAERAAAQI